MSPAHILKITSFFLASGNCLLSGRKLLSNAYRVRHRSYLLEVFLCRNLIHLPSAIRVKLILLVSYVHHDTLGKSLVFWFPTMQFFWVSNWSPNLYVQGSFSRPKATLIDSKILCRFFSFFLTAYFTFWISTLYCLKGFKCCSCWSFFFFFSCYSMIWRFDWFPSMFERYAMLTHIVLRSFIK